MNKVCPKCGANWPKGNFCPKDGATLLDAKPAPAAEKATAKPDDVETRIDRPVIRAEPAKGRKASAPDAKTVLDTPAIADDRPPSTPKMVAPSERQLSTRQKEEAAAESEAPASKGGGRGARAEKGFSETQWFMKGMEVDADLLEMVEQEEYDRDENISEEDRKGFTLRREDD